MNSLDIRQNFFDFFKKNGHEIVPSSSLIPAQDPTLLFTNAGMNQFKDVFLGKEKRSYSRAASSQKCVRAGGKHNDLDEVGFTNRHLTFFEMLGNFSFGDYFKKEAIVYAWEFLTKDMGLDEETLCVSVYKSDDEAYDIWHKEIGIPKKKIFQLGEEDNFWQMGDTGPCGPCSEIHVDKGVAAGCKQKNCNPSCGCNRFIEVWNLVFMQYDRQDDGTLLPLQQTGVDTGMGLERLCMVMQQKKSIFHTDLFQYLIDRIEELTNHKYTASSLENQSAFHVLCDHIRSSCLLLADGCSPSNEGRGYVLRKIIRRAVLFAKKLSNDILLFPELGKTFVDTMFPVFANLKEHKEFIITILTNEVERFSTSLEQGQQIFEKYVAQTKALERKIISGEKIFKLYDTYGFPPELTRVMALEKGFSLDMGGFEKEMEKQKLQSGKKTKKEKSVLSVPEDVNTKFVGYDALECTSKVVFVQSCNEGVWVITEESPFYVESGGQVGDCGWITIDDHSYLIKQLEKFGGENPAIAALLIMDEKAVEKAKKIKVGDEAHCAVDNFNRVNAEKNHTATHLLQAALVQVLGKQVKQAGSLVCQDYLRFDFTYQEMMTKDQVEQVEQIVNQRIRDDIALECFFTTLAQAEAQGVTAFFGEKYNPEKVRVVQIPGFSAELCGGTHVRRTGEIGCFKITSESALASGVRRIIAVTGPAAIKLFQSSFGAIKALSERYKVQPENVYQAVKREHEQCTELLRAMKQMRKQLITMSAGEWKEKIEQIGEIPFLFFALKDFTNDELLFACQEIEKLRPGFFFIVSQGDAENFQFIGYVSEQFREKVDLRNLSKILREKIGLQGGGRATIIQGGGIAVSQDIIKNSVKEWLIQFVG